MNLEVCFSTKELFFKFSSGKDLFAGNSSVQITELNVHVMVKQIKPVWLSGIKPSKSERGIRGIKLEPDFYLNFWTGNES